MIKSKFVHVVLCMSCLMACAPEALTEDDVDMSTGAVDMMVKPSDMGGMDMPAVIPDASADEGADMPVVPMNPFMVTDTAAVMAGEVIYTTNTLPGRGCSGCHGADGNGATAGVPMATTVTKTDAYMYDKIFNGVKFMTAYGKLAMNPMSEEEIWQVVTYLRATFTP